jgi:hypothetical protein
VIAQVAAPAAAAPAAVARKPAAQALVVGAFDGFVVECVGRHGSSSGIRVWTSTAPFGALRATGCPRRSRTADGQFGPMTWRALVNNGC